MKRIAGVLALAAMLTLAGCNGVLSGGDQQSTTSNSTVTPVDVPTDQPTATSAKQIAPGLTDEGVTSAGELMDAQTAFLANHSTVTHLNTSVIAQNGSRLFTMDQTIHRSPSGDPVRATINYTGSIPGYTNVTRLDSWTTDDGAYVRKTFENGTTTYSESLGRANAGSALSATTLSTYLSEADRNTSSVVTRDVNGSPRYLVSGNLTESDSPTNYRLTIDEQGVTRDLLVVRPNFGDSGEEIRAHATIESTGNESLEAPEWLSEARQQTRSTQTTNGATASTTYLGTSESELAENATATVTTQ